MPTIGLSNFFKTHSTLKSGNSFTSLPENLLIDMMVNNWDKREPGTGEGTCVDRKVLVPMDLELYAKPSFFLPPRMDLVEGMPIKAKVVARQAGEKPYVETYINVRDARKLGWKREPAEKAMVVCYSAEALLENNGTRSTECEWEAITLLCSTKEENVERMSLLTMARNQLEMVGGTKPNQPYSSDEWANAAWDRFTNCKVKVRD